MYHYFLIFYYSIILFTYSGYGLAFFRSMYMIVRYKMHIPVGQFTAYNITFFTHKFCCIWRFFGIWFVVFACCNMSSPFWKFTASKQTFFTVKITGVFFIHVCSKQLYTYRCHKKRLQKTQNNMLTIFIFSIRASKHYAAKRIFVIFWSPAFIFRTFIKCPKNITTY